MSYRHELKYLIHESDYHIIKIRVAGLLKRDPHAGSRGLYTVRSLYFDDFFNSAYNEKEISIKDRQKYRMRIYNYSRKVIHLERKIKDNYYIKKEVAPLSAREVDWINAGNFDFLKKSTQDLHRILYHEIKARLLRPRVMIDYEREPYVFDAGTVRVTFDRNIRAGFEPAGFFRNDTVMAETLETGFLVMEVKYTEFLPSVIRRILPTQSVDYSSISKYMMGCNRTLLKRQTDV